MTNNSNLSGNRKGAYLFARVRYRLNLMCRKITVGQLGSSVVVVCPDLTVCVCVCVCAQVEHGDASGSSPGNLPSQLAVVNRSS